MTEPFDEHAAGARLQRALRMARAGEDKDLATQVRSRGEEFLRALAASARMTRFHDLRNAAFDGPIAELRSGLAALCGMVGSVHVAFVENETYLNDAHLKFPADSNSGMEVGNFCRRRGVGGLVFHAPLDEAQARAFVRLIAAEPGAVEAPRSALRAALERNGLSSVEVRPPNRYVMSQDELPEVDPSVLAATLRAAKTVSALWEELAAGRPGNAVPVRRMVTTLVDRDAAPTDEAVGLLAHDQALPPHSRHSLQVATLAVLIGRELGLSPAQLSDLGVAACFHDSGYTAYVDGFSPPFERHAAAGAQRMLSQRGFHEARLKRMQVCIEHHRRADDPRRASLFARIVHVADDYDTLTRFRPGGPLLPPPHAVGGMWALRGREYDAALLQLFVNRVGPYPPGSLLALSDGSWVLVASGVRRPELFARPLTVLVRTPEGKAPPPGTLVDLASGGAIREVLNPRLPAG